MALWLVVNTLVNRPVESVAGLVLIALGLPVYWYFRGAKESGSLDQSHLAGAVDISPPVPKS